MDLNQAGGGGVASQKSVSKDNFFNIANILTLSRIVLGFVFFALFIFLKSSKLDYKNEMVLLIALFFIFVIAIVTDALDGFSARKLGIVTDFGKHFDPLADSIFFILVFFTFVMVGIMPIYLFLIIFIREFIMHLFLRPYVKRKGFYLPANIIGKIKTFLQCMFSLTIILFLIARRVLIHKEIDISIYDSVFSINSLIFFIIITFFSLFSFFVYLLDIRKVLKSRA